MFGPSHPHIIFSLLGATKHDVSYAFVLHCEFVKTVLQDPTRTLFTLGATEPSAVDATIISDLGCNWVLGSKKIDYFTPANTSGPLVWCNSRIWAIGVRMNQFGLPWLCNGTTNYLRLFRERWNLFRVLRNGNTCIVYWSNPSILGFYRWDWWADAKSSNTLKSMTLLWVFNAINGLGMICNLRTIRLGRSSVLHLGLRNCNFQGYVLVYLRSATFWFNQ